MTCLLLSSISFSQTGESIYKKVTINAVEKSITVLLPSFEIMDLSFRDQDNNRQIDSNEKGVLQFFIVNTGINELSGLAAGIGDMNKNDGLKFPGTYNIKPVGIGDSVLVEVPVQAGDSLADGTAVFNVSVEDHNRTVMKTAEISVPVRDLFTKPAFVWITPYSELVRTDFPYFEITGQVTSNSRINSLTLYINGEPAQDKITFIVVPTGNPGEYLLKRNLSLQPGFNEIRVEVENTRGSVMSDARVLNFSTQKTDQTYREKRLALIIGNSNYQSGNILENPVNDARAISVALQKLGFEVMNYLDADQRTMKKAMDEFGLKLREYNVGLFYFAGHALQLNGINYMIPVDASLKIAQDVDYDCIDVGRLVGKMEDAGSLTNIIILDACRDNPFERSWKGKGTGGAGLASMNAPAGSIIAYATSPGTTASDGTGKNGLYTEAFLQHINTPGLPIEEFFKKVRVSVETKSNKKQIPWESTSLKRSFYFRLK
jgi:hypothetical protein